jgi:hypothetical protein
MDFFKNVLLSVFLLRAGSLRDTRLKFPGQE